MEDIMFLNPYIIGLGVFMLICAIGFIYFIEQLTVNKIRKILFIISLGISCVAIPIITMVVF